MSREIISIATTNPTTIRPDDILGDAIKIMAKQGFRRLPVIDRMPGPESREMVLVGILTATDVLKALEKGDLEVIEMEVSNFMTPEPTFVYRSDDLTQAVQLMNNHNLGSLPVIAEGSQTLAGIVTERDLVKHFSEVADADLAQFITPDPITLPYDTTTIEEIIDSMVKAQIRRAILVDENKVVKGIVTATDMMKFISDQIIRMGKVDVEILQTKAKEIAVKDVIVVNIGQSMAEVAKIFTEKEMGGVPVVDDNEELIGIFTERDLLAVVALYQLM